MKSWKGVKGMAKRYSSVLDMVRDTASAEFAEQAESYLGERQVSRILYGLRCKADLSQTQLAKRVGTSQSRISKLEQSTDQNMKLGDLEAYAEALGMQVQIRFSRPMTAVDRIKSSALEIKEQFVLLAKLAQDDHKIREGVGDFFLEYLWNVFYLFQGGWKILAVRKEETPEELEQLYLDFFARTVVLLEKNEEILAAEEPEEEPEPAQVLSVEPPLELDLPFRMAAG